MELIYSKKQPEKLLHIIHKSDEFHTIEDGHRRDVVGEKDLNKKLTFLNRNMDIQSPLIRSRFEKKKKESLAKKKENKYFFKRKQLLKRNTFIVDFSNTFESLSFEGTRARDPENSEKKIGKF